MMKRLAWGVVALHLIVTVVLSGCVKQVRSTVPAFAQAAELTSTNVQSALQTVETNYYATNAFTYSVNYDGNWNPSKIPTSWLTPEAMNVRVEILEGLKKYASELSGLTGSNDVDQLNKASTAVGQSLKGLVGTPQFQKMSAAKSLPDNFSSLAAAAVDALGNWLIELKLQQNLPSEIEKMDPNIQKICTLLEADIGAVDMNIQNSIEGSGVRQVVWISYNQRIITQNQYILHNQCTSERTTNCLSGNDRLAEIQKLPALVQQQRTTDQTLKQVQATVKQLAAAHTELLKAVQSKQTLTADLGNLLAEAQRLNTYYQTLASSK